MWSLLSYLTVCILLLSGIKLADEIILKKNRFNILHNITTLLCIILILVFEYLTLTNSFNYKEIFENSSKYLPLIYKLSVLWASQGGSLLLWLTLVEITIYFAKPRTSFSRVIAILSEIPLAIMVAFIENPFTVLHFKPSFGAGMNLLLQTPEMVVHPILLFAGYATITAPIIYTADNIYTKRHYIHIKASSEISWVLLTMGIMWGALWSYKVLGWGGFWGWDPVENSSIIPWLILSAAIHLKLSDKYKLYCLQSAYISSLLGTMVTRSGLLSQISNHAWWSRLSYPIIYTTIIWSIIYLITTHIIFNKIGNSPHNNTQTLMKQLMNITSLILILSAIVILIGIYTPIITKYILHNPINVSPEFYKSSLKPLGAMLFVITAACFYYKFSKKFIIYLTATLLLTSTTLHILFHTPPNATIAGAIAATGILFTVLSKKRVPLKLIHIGLLIVFAAVIFAWSMQVSKTIVLTKNTLATFHGYSLTYTGSETKLLTKRAIIITKFNIYISKNGNRFILHPLLKIKLGMQYNQLIATAFAAIPAIHTSITHDLWVVPDVTVYSNIYYKMGTTELFHILSNGNVIWVKCEYTPGILWIWIGCYIAVLGALIDATHAIRTIYIVPRKTINHGQD